MKRLQYLLLLMAAFASGGCDLLMGPLDDNHDNGDRLYQDPAYAEGLLAYAYSRLPINNFTWEDVATDNAVTNDKVSNYLRMATGQWSSTFNPVNRWDACQQGIQSINHFLTLVDSVNWRKSNPAVHELYIRRFRGESYALRALLRYHLLVTVAGRDESGRLMGIPLVDKYLHEAADFDIPRATFAESVDNIYHEIDKALFYLTMDDYRTISDKAQLPPGYENFDVEDYNIVFGDETALRISGRIAKALRARTALLAASPLFSDDAALWEKAAVYAGDLLGTIGGVSGMDPDGHRWYLKSLIDNISLAGSPARDQPEMIWRSTKSSRNDWERECFPPTHFGNGRMNPTQNLVDAFPMRNGYPIAHPQSQYDPLDPYSGRDPRLGMYIIYNGTPYKGTTITTAAGGRENAKDSIPTSTRTGYYMKKLLIEEVSLVSTSTSYEDHYFVHMRYTEFFLNYAEAANEAWGPDGDPNGYGFTARDVIAAIRRRAGIDQPDTYLAGISDKAAMREVIRNERRLELCFEGFRFWDLRRWNADLTETARGVDINRTATSYTYVDVEERLYRDYMYSGPIPYTEQIKYGHLVQNAGW